MSRWVSIESSLKSIIDDCSFFLNCDTLDKSVRDIDDLYRISHYAESLLKFTQRRDDMPDDIFDFYPPPECFVKVSTVKSSEVTHVSEFPVQPLIFDFEL